MRGRRPVLRVLLLLAALAACTLTACGSGPAPTPLTIAVTGSMAEPAPWAPVLEDLAVRHGLRALDPGDGKVSVVVSTNPQVTEVDLTPLRDAREVEQDQATARERVLAKAAKLRSALTGAGRRRTAWTSWAPTAGPCAPPPTAARSSSCRRASRPPIHWICARSAGTSTPTPSCGT